MAGSVSFPFPRSLLPLCNLSSSLGSKSSFSFTHHSLKLLPSLCSRAASSREFGEPQLMESQETLPGIESSAGLVTDGSEQAPLAVEGDVDKLSLNGNFHKLYLKNDYGETLVGILHDDGTKELVILCHGFRSSKESKTIMSIADALTNGKISVFRFDFSGNGESEGSFQYGNYWKEVEDLRVVVLHFMNQKRPVRAIIGHSKGGNVVLLYAAKYHDIPVVINISGRFDLKRGIEERLGKDFMQTIAKEGFIDKMDKLGRFMYRVTEESLMKRLSTDVLAACLGINEKCSVLTIHGSEDVVVPPEDALKFAESISNHKLQIIEGADHTYTSHHFQLARILLDFVRDAGTGR